MDSKRRKIIKSNENGEIKLQIEDKKESNLEPITTENKSIEERKENNNENNNKIEIKNEIGNENEVNEEISKTDKTIENNEDNHIEIEKNDENTFVVIRKCFERLGTSQVLDFVTKETIENSEMFQQLVEKFSNRKELRKIFVRSIDFEANEDTLKKALEKFGQVEECSLVRHSDSKKPKGFGFAIFKTFKSMFTALKTGEIEICGRTAYIHFAVHKDDEYRPNNIENDQEIIENSKKQPDRQIFIRNLGDKVNIDDLKKVFEKFGKIEHCAVPVDSNSGKQKGYGFVRFHNIEHAKKSIKEPDKEINGVTIHCDFSTKRKKENNKNQNRSRKNERKKDHRNKDYYERDRNYSPSRNYTDSYYNESYPGRYPSQNYQTSLHYPPRIEKPVIGTPVNGEIQMKLQQLQLEQAKLVHRLNSGQIDSNDFLGQKHSLDGNRLLREPRGFYSANDDAYGEGGYRSSLGKEGTKKEF